MGNTRQSILDASGYPALKAKADALDAEQDRLRDCIVAYQARTIADVAAMVRFMGRWEFAELMEGLTQPDDMSISERLYAGLLADVERLAKPA